ncbi:MAG TPA: hypothetical protein VGE40_03375 [Bacilli bacterium]
MGYMWLVSLFLVAWIFFKFGAKYQDLQDLMLARRIAKIIKQSNLLKESQEAYEAYMKDDPSLKHV